MEKYVRFAIVFVVLVTVAAATGCGGARGGLLRKSPGEVVEAAYMAANAGQYSEAEKYLSSEVVSAMKGSLGAMGGGMKGLWDSETRRGTIDRIEILSETIRGEGATVQFRYHFQRGNTEDNDSHLIMQSGQWKITFE